MDFAAFLRWMILGPLFAVFVVLGYLYNGLCLIVLLYNGVPLSRKLVFSLAIPFGVALWAHIVVGWSLVTWVHHFYSMRDYVDIWAEIDYEGVFSDEERSEPDGGVSPPVGY